MAPLSDLELDEILQAWEAPSAPRNLERSLRNRLNRPWWKWLLTGSIQVPVPLTLAVAAAFIALIIVAVVRGPAQNAVVRDKNPPGLQPVKRLEVRIIRSNYEGDR
jgi:hypothetical protein